MKHRTRNFVQLAGILGLLALTRPVEAQTGSRVNRPINSPTISPYLNMFRGGGAGGANAGLNYFGLVRPQQQFAQQNQALTQGLQSLQAQQLQGGQMMPGAGLYGVSQLGTTGHPVLFNSFGTSTFGGGFTGLMTGTPGGGFGSGLTGSFSTGVAGGGFGGIPIPAGGWNGAGNTGGVPAPGGLPAGPIPGGGPAMSGSGFPVGGFGGSLMGVTGHPAMFGTIVPPSVGLPPQ